MRFGVTVISNRKSEIIVEDKETREIWRWDWVRRKEAWAFALSRKKPIRFVAKRGMECEV